MSADLNELRGGAIAVNKPQGVTSHDVVNKIRKLYGTRRVGHTGTLDPLATGVLVVLVGKAVKASDILVCDRKKYKAKIKLGIVSDTEDITGNLTYTNAKIPEMSDVLRVIGGFVGEIAQVPPMYSALKVGGKKLVDMARQGIEVEREPRKITVYSIDAHGDGDEYEMDVECSKGTYIRTLCADIGKALGTGAVMSALERERSGAFGISDAYTLEALENMSPEERISALLPCDTLFEDLPKVTLPEFFEKLFSNGCEIYQKKIGTSFDAGTTVRVCGKSGFIGVGVVCEYESGTAIKVKAFL